MLRAPIYLTVSGALPLLLCAIGCTHLHSDADEKTAKAISTTFEAYRRPSDSVYATMLNNHAHVVQAVHEQQREFAHDREQAFLYQLDSVTWDQVAATLDNAEKSRGDLNNLILERIKKVLRELGVNDSEMKTATEAEQKAHEILTQASNDELRWQAKSQLFQETIKLVAREGAIDQNVIRGLKVAATQPVQGSKQSLEEVLAPDLQSVQKDATRPADILKLLKTYTSGLFDTGSAPGINITILGLRADLAAAAVKRATVAKDYINSQIKVLKDAMLVRNTFLDMRSQLTAHESAPPAALNFHGKDMVIVTLNYLRQPIANFAGEAAEVEKAKALRGAYEILAAYVLARTVDDPQAAELELNARLLEAKHDYSIQLSQANAEEDEAVVGRGIDALVAYHSGGVTPEQIANLVRLLQTAGLAAIANGVN